MERTNFIHSEFKTVYQCRIDLIEPDMENHTNSRHYQSRYNENRKTEIVYDEIRRTATDIINSGLKTELDRYVSFPIETVMVQGVYDGSIVLIFTVVLRVLETIGGIKDLYDTVILIQEISEKFIETKMRNRYGRLIKTDVYTLYPSHRHGICEREIEYAAYRADISETTKNKGVFFFYLLTANVVLMIIIGVLVFFAVKMVYFSGA